MIDVREPRPRRSWLVAAVFGIAATLALFPAGAEASNVIALGPGQRARVVDDPFLTAIATTPIPETLASASAHRRPRRHKNHCIVCAVLMKLRHAGAIADATYQQYRGVYSAATAALRRLQGTRAAELGAVIANVQQMAAAGLLTAPRLPAVFETLDRNRQWWTTGPLLASYQRVEFSGSQLVWEYYPGQGIELQVLANFGKADGLYTAGSAQYPNLRALLDELIPLAVQRAGGLAWEYYFQFDGGSPPWISAMAQGTAIEALTREYRASGDRSYLDLAHRALAVLRVMPPVGVGVPTALGRRYVQYSFAPGADILNAFLQTLIGLYDYAHASGDPLAGALFAAGDAEARAEVPRYDTGAWSLYQSGLEDTLSYHLLVTGFLQQLCARTHAAVYCVTAQHFAGYLKTPPSLTLLTARLRRRTPGMIRFRLSKDSHVGIVIMRGQQTLLATSAYFAYGVGAFAVPPLAPGSYTVRLAATDLAGNFTRIKGTLSVPAPPRRHKH
jgi:D-glucuronyl C5-epimerase C-terminus